MLQAREAGRGGGGTSDQWAGQGQGGGGTSGQLNVFIPERQMSLDQAILQGEEQSLVELAMKVREDFTIKEKAPTIGGKYQSERARRP